MPSFPDEPSDGDTTARSDGIFLPAKIELNDATEKK